MISIQKRFFVEKEGNDTCVFYIGNNVVCFDVGGEYDDPLCYMSMDKSELAEFINILNSMYEEL